MIVAWGGPFSSTSNRTWALEGIRLCLRADSSVSLSVPEMFFDDPGLPHFDARDGEYN